MCVIREIPVKIKRQFSIPNDASIWWNHENTKFSWFHQNIEHQNQIFEITQHPNNRFGFDRKTLIDKGRNRGGSGGNTLEFAMRFEGDESKWWRWDGVDDEEGTSSSGWRMGWWWWWVMVWW